MDCLAIAHSIGEIVLCLSREVGTLAWDDYLLDVMKWGNTMSESLHTCVDDLLTDWTFSEWDNLDIPGNII